MLSIFHKLLELQKSVIGLTKDKNGNSYQYVSGDKILSIVRPKMDELGLILIPEVTDYQFTRQDYSVKSGTKTEMFCSLKMRFTWVDAESGEKVECSWASSGQNSFDKSLGSAVTYAERYFLLKFFHIATDKDDVDAPRTPEQELNVQQAIGYINSLNTRDEMLAAWNYYSQFAISKDRELIMAYNKRMKEVNNAANK